MGRTEIHAEATIHAAPEKVFEILADGARIKHWMPNVSDVKLGTPKSGAGAQRNVTLKIQGLKVHAHQRITAHEPNKRIAWEHVTNELNGKPLDMLEDVGTRFDLKASGKSTHVKATMHYQTKGIKAKLAAGLISKEVEGLLTKSLENISKLAAKA